jgi:hypothetical protein
MLTNDHSPTICHWCHYSEHTPAPYRYGSIPLCWTHYHYATDSDKRTRESLPKEETKARYAA